MNEPFGPDLWEVRVDRPYADREVSAVRVLVRPPTGGGMIEGRGSSKRHPNDDHDAGIARGLALGRALQDVGRQLEDSALCESRRRYEQGAALRSFVMHLEEPPPEVKNIVERIRAALLRGIG